jgi:hypothetical protein
MMTQYRVFKTTAGVRYLREDRMVGDRLIWAFVVWLDKRPY